MEVYSKTNWVNDETELNQDNMNKIEDQLETLTNYDIDNDSKACMSITSDDITNWNNKAETSDIPTNVSVLTNDSGYQTEDEVNTLISNAIGSALGGEY